VHTLADSAQLTDVLVNKLGFPIILAIISGLVSYVAGRRLEGKKNQATLKQLSWDLKVNARLVEVKDELKEQVQVRYAGSAVENLTTVVVRIFNTGGATVKDEYVRFAFPEGARVLEVGLDPTPEPELEVSEVTEDVPPGDRKFRLGHLEPEQSVGFRVISDGGDWAGWSGIHAKNVEGGVAFVRRDVSRVRADQEHIRPFVVQAVLLVLVQLVFDIGGNFGDFAQLLRIAATLLVSGLMVPHLLPVARLVEQLVVRSLTKQREGEVGNTIRGEVGGYAVQAGSIYGGITIRQAAGDDDEAETDVEGS
jgi:hypothetical protein